MASSVQLCAEVTVSKEDAERTLSEHTATRDTKYRDVQSNAKKVLVVSFS